MQTKWSTASESPPNKPLRFDATKNGWKYVEEITEPIEKKKDKKKGKEKDKRKQKKK